VPPQTVHCAAADGPAVLSAAFWGSNVLYGACVQKGDTSNKVASRPMLWVAAVKDTQPVRPCW